MEDIYPDSLFPGNVYDQTDEEIHHERIRQKKLAQYLKAKDSYEEKMSIEVPYARNCCQHKRGNMYWWEDDHDCIEYPNICMWMKGKMKLREIYDPENDTWHILNPDQRLAHYLGAEYELMTWNPLMSSPLDHVMRSYLYLGVIYIIDWHTSVTRAGNDTESVWSSFRPCGDIEPGFSEIIEDYPLVTKPIQSENQKIKDILQKYLPMIDDNSEKIPEGLYLQLMNLNKEIYDAIS